MITRENCKSLLGCDDEQLDELIETWRALLNIGINLSLDEFVVFVHNLTSDLSIINGDNVEDPVGILGKSE